MAASTMVFDNEIEPRRLIYVISCFPTIRRCRADALAHFEALLQFETDCWDVHHALSNGRQDFVLLDVRGEELYRNGHIPTAINLPHSRINEESLVEYVNGTLFVVYCAGFHCNGADKAAIRLARLNRPVKKMIGGVTGWLDEGFSLDGAVENDWPID